MAFFTNSQQLASLFTPENFHDRERHGKYLEGGLKPIEAFCTDISQNLVEWAVCDKSIFYKTKDHWYEFRLDSGNYAGKVVWMTRYDIRTWRRLDDFANLSSVSHYGREFLTKHRDLQVPLFEGA